MSVIYFLLFLCNLSCLLYISTSVWLVRKTVFCSRVFLVFFGMLTWYVTQMWSKLFSNVTSLLSSLAFPPSPFFPSWFCVVSPLQSLSGASCCITSEVHSPKTQDLPPLRWTWVFLVTEQKFWSTYFHVYGWQMTVTCQGLMRARRQHFGKVFWPAHLHSWVYWVIFSLWCESFWNVRGEKKRFWKGRKRELTKEKKSPTKETWMLSQECFVSEFSLIWATLLERHCMTRAIRNGTDCPQSVSFLSPHCKWYISATTASSGAKLRNLLNLVGR